jgi:hypothetical protein
MMMPSKNRVIGRYPTGIDRECIVVFLFVIEAFQCSGRFKLNLAEPRLKG